MPQSHFAGHQSQSLPDHHIWKWCCWPASVGSRSEEDILRPAWVRAKNLVVGERTGSSPDVLNGSKHPASLPGIITAIYDPWRAVKRPGRGLEVTALAGNRPWADRKSTLSWPACKICQVSSRRLAGHFPAAFLRPGGGLGETVNRSSSSAGLLQDCDGWLTVSAIVFQVCSSPFQVLFTAPCGLIADHLPATWWFWLFAKVQF